MTTNADCRCITCDYDLRSLSATGLCPECGAPVRDTLEAMKRGGFSSTADLRRAKRILALLSCVLACIFLIRLVQPFEEALRQSTSSMLALPPLTSALYFQGDQLLACVLTLLCCFQLLILPRFHGSFQFRVLALRVSVRSAAITAVVLAATATTAVVVETVGWWQGMRPPPNAAIQLLWWIEKMGCTACQPWAVALVSLSVMLYCASVFARSNQPETARRHRHIGGTLCLLLILCTLPSAIAQTIANVGGSTSFLSFQFRYIDGLLGALSTLSVGATALVVAAFTRNTLSPATFDANEQSIHIPTFPKNAHDLLTFMCWSPAFLAAITVMISLGPFLATIANVYVLVTFPFIGMSILILCVVTEILVIIRLSRMLANFPTLSFSWRRIRNARLALWLAFVAYFILAALGPGHRYLDITVVLFVGAIPVVYTRLSHGLIIRLRALLAGQLPTTPRWYEPRVATLIGALVLLYFLLMQSGRNLSSMGATRIVLSTKDGIGYLAFAVAAWAFAQLSWTGLRLRRQAAALVTASAKAESNEAASRA